VPFFVVPPEGLYVNREEVRYTPGSHHVLIYKTPYTSIPTQDIHGNTVDTSGIIDAPNGGTADWKIDGVVAGAQSANAPPIVEDLPPNVALELPGGTVLLMNTHYLNTTSSKVTVEARVNLWTVPAAQVTQEEGPARRQRLVLRKIAPRRARSKDPEDAVDDEPVVLGRPPNRRLLRRQQRLQLGRSASSRSPRFMRQT
jgi:hypothetical protein